MQVSMTGRHVELTDPLKQYVQEKLKHLKHSFDQVVDVHVVLSVEKFRQRCEISIQANRLNIHGSHETEDMYASIDGVVDKLSRQLKRYRAKMRKHQVSPENNTPAIQVSHRILATASEEEELAVDRVPEVLDMERMPAKPMSVDEAVMQLELSDRQPVLIFTNQDTNSMNVLYRRGDGRLGWIEPEQA
ncbi:MAG: ribosome-associated translation inhibitor RaiA [Mariprofundaceae bacterium]|nr:ribosome-associated translation inhibitor RaiA [Mariprofundaceae bacterium]